MYVERLVQSYEHYTNYWNIPKHTQIYRNVNLVVMLEVRLINKRVKQTTDKCDIV